MKPQIAKKIHGCTTWRHPRSAHTLALHMAREEESLRKDRAARIAELRGGIPQPRIAEQVGVSMRAYQEWEAGGGITHDNLIRLAECFRVSPEYIEYGTAGRPLPGTNFERLERRVDALLWAANLDPISFEVPAETPEDVVRDEEDDQHEDKPREGDESG